MIRPLGGSPKKAAVATRIEEGDKVEADYRGKGRYYPGKIVRDRRDGTYDIDYADGEKETRVDEKMIRLPDDRGRGAADRDDTNHRRKASSRSRSRSPESKRGGDDHRTKDKGLARVLSGRTKDSLMEVIRKYQAKNDTRWHTSSLLVLIDISNPTLHPPPFLNPFLTPFKCCFHPRLLSTSVVAKSSNLPTRPHPPAMPPKKNSKAR